MGRAAEVLVLAAAPLALLGALLAKAPIAQLPDYHDFADQRALLGIPHFWNIVSNLPFVLVGALGLALLRGRPPGASAAWAVMFGATLLVGLGSAYYHLVPGDATLVWDRLPIGVAFMAFSAALIGEHAGRGERLLLPLVLFSIAAVYWWRFTGDLSLWVWVQLAPMIGVVLALAFLPARYTHRRYLLYALLCYAAAKAAEFADHPLMQWTGGALSGHTLKHLAAAAGVAFLYVMLRRRAAIR